jgi:hypothetical protein
MPNRSTELPRPPIWPKLNGMPPRPTPLGRITGESDDLKRFRPFLLRPAGFADAAEGDEVDSPGGCESAGVGAVDVAVMFVILGAVSPVVDSVIVDVGAGEIAGVLGVADEMETIAGSFHEGTSCTVSVAGAGAGAGSSLAAGVGAVHAEAGSSSHVGPVAVVGSSQPVGSSFLAGGVEGAEGAGSAAGVVGSVAGCEGAGARTGAGATVEGMTGVAGLGGSFGLEITGNMQNVNIRVSKANIVR